MTDVKNNPTHVDGMKPQSVLGLGAFALAINQIFDRATQLIQQAENSGLILEVNGGAQVLNLINQAKDAFSSELTSTAQTLSAQQQQLISSLSGMLDDIQNHVLKDLTAKIQQTANTIPFAKTFPQLTFFEGNIIAPSTNATNTVTLTGNFFDIGSKNYDAVLKVGNNSYKNSSKTTQQIMFQIPQSEFIHSPNQVNYTTISVDIPYKKTWLFFFKCKKSTSFLLNFIILPINSGSYQVVVTKATNIPQSEIATCNGLIWDSAQDDIDKVQGCDMSDGWSCDRNSVTYSFTRREGDQNNDWFDLGNVSTPTFVGWHFKTLHKLFGTSGKLTVNLTYTRYKTITQPVTTTGPSVNLLWGETKVETVDPQASWKIVYHQFDGRIFEFSSSEETNPYLKITTLGNQIQLTTIPD